jgi:hypothetical protein
MTHFERVTAQHLKSSTGFEILPAGRFGLIYKEGNKQIEVEIEFGGAAENPSITVPIGAFRFWSDSNIEISKKEQLRIEHNFKLATEFDGFRFLVWDDNTSKYVEHTV